MEELLAAIDEAVAIADEIRAKYDDIMLGINEIHTRMLEFAKERKLPDLCSRILEEHPEKRREIQRRILAMCCEGRRLEESLIR